MAVTDLPLLAMLRSRMQWQQARQTLIAENVANADMPGFRPRDLTALRLDPATGKPATSGTLALTQAGHMAPAGVGGPGADPRKTKSFEVRPSGNAVNLEEEMMKAGDNQSDYQLAASMYQKSLDTLKIAIGKR